MGKLTDTACRNASHATTGDKKLADGAGMYLHVLKSGKYWRLRYKLGGKENTYSIGVYPAVSLVQARKTAETARDLAKRGIDPNQRKAADKIAAMQDGEATFASAANGWLEQWSVGKAVHTVHYTCQRLQADVLPAIGALPITAVTAPMLIAIAKKIERRGAADVAARVLNMCSQIFRYAVAHGLAASNPASFIKPRDILPQRKVINQPRIDAKELPALLRAVQAYDGRHLTRWAIQLMALTFVRTGELIAARWDEFDLAAARWDIPAARMKMNSPHIVPLSRQALALLEQIKEVTGRSQWLFPHESNPRKCMSNNTILFALYRLGYKGRMTGHGFRGVASTVLHEQGFDHAHIELQLAHMERNEVSAAYNHATYLRQRASMMQWWGDYLDSVQAGNVLMLPQRVA